MVGGWSALDDYICGWLDSDPDDPVHSRSRLKPDKFGDWLHYYHESVDPSYFDLAFPVGLPTGHGRDRQQLFEHAISDFDSQSPILNDKNRRC